MGCNILRWWREIKLIEKATEEKWRHLIDRDVEADKKDDYDEDNDDDDDDDDDDSSNNISTL